MATDQLGSLYKSINSIYKTRKAAKFHALKCEEVVAVDSVWKRCDIGCFCIEVPKRRIGYAKRMKAK